ncbi:MAG: hypothetical protein A3I24_04550 [Candidatus Harrisonbacteria bacterium RIFCSPLOWO2_02_FULL_41_13b]|uniref:DUF4129 domain-containing protein n=1 Tax=Candidatus Harrisonbacteria bacterium RIFCSPLOWO2_02_FULL_41_13b TaxID=1798409 RepID=A0A1G1ZSM5_9BACT|nr:MAG: hypothetical protein A3J53_02780 [Candidatus Harrisonbacteria bacterium RIFCSPHIGHO2_02_FULL_40_20]OGY66760.1 MAG: hypothetical protein A3I24_04550 [Candidatus Harrisonbacteria bacterium RIFCSPLOWO2_02_FULL_41_13b]
MDQFIPIVIEYFFKIRDFGGQILTPALPLLKVISLGLSAFFIWGIYYCIAGSGYARKRFDEFSDAIGIGDTGKRRQWRTWKRILKRLKSNDMVRWKMAILDADAIFDDILKMGGYRGNDVHERFQQLPPTAISNVEQIQIAHKIRDRVRQESNFVISKVEAEEVIKSYGQAFKELGLIE